MHQLTDDLITIGSQGDMAGFTTPCATRQFAPYVKGVQFEKPIRATHESVLLVLADTAAVAVTHSLSSHRAANGLSIRLDYGSLSAPSTYVQAARFPVRTDAWWGFEIVLHESLKLTVDRDALGHVSAVTSSDHARREPVSLGCIRYVSPALTMAYWVTKQAAATFLLDAETWTAWGCLTTNEGNFRTTVGSASFQPRIR